MKIIYFLALVSTFCFTSFSQDFDEDYGYPVIVLTEYDPWLWIIGSDVPTIAIYESGNVIYKRENKSKKFEYFTVRLDSTELFDLFSELNISDSLIQMSEYLRASNSSDQPTNELVIVSDSVYIKKVYGRLRNKDDNSRTETPDYFLSVYDKLIEFKDSREEEWKPTLIELLAQPFGKEKSKPLVWPESLPSAKSPYFVKRGKQLVSIYLTREQFEEFQELQKKKKKGQPYSIGKKNYIVPLIRFPFPNIN